MQTADLKFWHRGVLTLALAVGATAPLAGKPFERVGKKREARQVQRTYNNGFGIELGAGNYNGVTYMRRLDKYRHIQSMIGFRLFESQLLGTFDYIFSFPRIIPLIPDVAPYIGGGVTFVLHDEFESLLGTEDDSKYYVGARVPAGASIDVHLFDLPFYLYAEATPGILFVPAGRAFMGITLGIRYLF